MQDKIMIISESPVFDETVLLPGAITPGWTCQNSLKNTKGIDLKIDELTCPAHAHSQEQFWQYNGMQHQR